MLNYGASFPRLQAAATFHPSALASLIDQGSSKKLQCVVSVVQLHQLVLQLGQLGRLGQRGRQPGQLGQLGQLGRLGELGHKRRFLPLRRVQPPSLRRFQPLMPLDCDRR